MVGDTRDYHIKKYAIDRLYCEMVVQKKINLKVTRINKITFYFNTGI